MGWIIVGAWLTSVVYSALDRTYDPPPALQILMTALIAYLFGPKITGRGGGNDAS